jgi:hypothetical protein
MKKFPYDMPAMNSKNRCKQNVSQVCFSLAMRKEAKCAVGTKATKHGDSEYCARHFFLLEKEDEKKTAKTSSY